MHIYWLVLEDLLGHIMVDDCYSNFNMLMPVMLGIVRGRSAVETTDDCEHPRRVQALLGVR